MVTSPDRLAQALQGRYTLQREIGAGGMAVVYLAHDHKHGRDVAIKVLRTELAATVGAERFLREIEIAARLSHPHILPLFDSGAADDLLYYVMPFVPGESLRSKLARERQLPVDDAVRLTREVASAIGFAHQQGIVHRDIKPENILLADGIALVADFGIARALRSNKENGATTLTVVGLTVGTPAYMSPEQFAADEVDGRSDLYALGCVLYEMLAGQPPFVAASAEAMLRQHLIAEPRPITEHRPTVSVGLARVIAKSLAKEPADRFATAASFAEAIATVVSGSISPIAPAERSATPNNLPRQRTRFIGRDHELAECARLLGDSRLLTLTGIGGSGKTRVALRLAEIMLPTFPDGVWFVDLAPLVDSGRVAAAAAQALSVSESAGKSPVQAIREALAGKRVLLVLDNCEHLLAAASDLANEVLTIDGDIRLVATSREGLGIEGERLFAVRSMSIATDPKALEQSDAVRFFVDRAQAADRNFSLTRANTPLIAEICRRLDGIPLAIELAAARIKVLSVEQIRSRLDDRFKLLTGGRSAVPRQQTLLATIQWSYDQLNQDEQSLLRALAVFAGGWTLESATAVAGDNADEFEVLDILTRLIDKSLVMVDHTGGEARYGMLESVRQFGLERLVAASESDRVRDRHAAFFQSIAERFSAEKFQREEYWGTRLTRELDNLRAALWFLRDHDAERYLELVGALGYFWWGRSHIVEGREHLRAVMEMVSPQPVRKPYLRALIGLTLLSAYEGEQEKSRALTVTMLAMARELGDKTAMTIALEVLGYAQFLTGDVEAALATFEEMLAIQLAAGDSVLINRAKAGLSQVLVALHRIDEARRFSREVVDVSRALGDRRNEHFGVHYLADCALIEGKCAEALGLYLESLFLAEVIGDRIETSAEVEGIAMALAGLGHHAAALRLHSAVRAEWARHGLNMKIQFWDELVVRYFQAAREALGREQAEVAEAAGRVMTLEAAVAEAKSLASSK